MIRKRDCVAKSVRKDRSAACPWIAEKIASGIHAIATAIAARTSTGVVASRNRSRGLHG